MEMNEVFKSILEADRAPIVVCDLDHTIIYMNPSAIRRYEKWGGISLVGKSIMECHNEESRANIIKVTEWFKESKDNDQVFTSYNPKENKDVYMVALRNDNGELIAYYEKHEYRNRETMEPYDMKKFFESDYARCEYVEEDNAVFHIWKKEAHYADYRNPVIASLEMLKKHEGSILIVDARNGFEDVPEDVDWGFQWFLPELKQTGCEVWGFILPEVSDIDGEIDLWTKEIEKNFTVIRAESYDEIVKKAKEL